MADWERWDRKSLAEFAQQALEKLELLDAELSRLRDEVAATNQDRRLLLERWRETTRMNEALVMKIGALERREGQR